MDDKSHADRYRHTKADGHTQTKTYTVRQRQTSVCCIENEKEKEKEKMKWNASIETPTVWFKVSSERLSPEIDILIWSPIKTQTEHNNA